MARLPPRDRKALRAQRPQPDLAAAFTAAFPTGIDHAADREQAMGSLAELARRAKDAGRLRPDFVLDDLLLMLMASRGLHAASPAALVAASRRFAALAIQAFQALPDGTGTPTPTQRVKTDISGFVVR